MSKRDDLARRLLEIAGKSESVFDAGLLRDAATYLTTDRYAAGWLAGRNEAAKIGMERALRCGHRALPKNVGEACYAAIRALPVPEEGLCQPIKESA